MVCIFRSGKLAFVRVQKSPYALNEYINDKLRVKYYKFVLHRSVTSPYIQNTQYGVLTFHE